MKLQLFLPKKTRGMSFVEVLVTILFLTTSGLALYTATIRNVKETEWTAENVMAETALKDLGEVYLAEPFTELKALPQNEAAVTAVDMKKLEEMVPLSSSSFMSDPGNPGSATDIANDPIYATYQKLVESLEFKRKVFFSLNPTNPNQGVLTCQVQYKSQALGDRLQTKTRKFVVFGEG